MGDKQIPPNSPSKPVETQGTSSPNENSSEQPTTSSNEPREPQENPSKTNSEQQTTSTYHKPDKDQGTSTLDDIDSEPLAGPSKPDDHVSFNPTPDLAKAGSQDSFLLDADMVEIVLFHVDDMGVYQKILFVCMFPFAVFFAWVYFVQMFLVATPQTYWCKVPELAGLSKSLRRDLSAPGVGTVKWDSCMVYAVNWSEVIRDEKPPPADTRRVPCKNGWEFDYNDIPFDTVVSERGWVCDRATYIPIAQTMFFAGAFTGGLIFGWTADRFGRVPAMMGVNTVGAIAGIATTYTKGAWDFIFCRFLVGMSFDNCFFIVFILVLEYVGPGHRTWVANMPIALYYGAGALALPWIAYFVRNWRVLMWITSVPMFCALPAPYVFPESVRWLVSQGKVDKAVKVLRKFERVNGTKIPDDVMKMFIASSRKMISAKKESFTSLFKSTLLRTVALCMVGLYCLCALVYDVLVRMSENFGMDFFVTFTINAAAEIPSVLLVTLLLDRLGRRNLAWIAVGVSCIFTFFAMLVPKGGYRVGLAAASRFLINLAFTVECQWVAEILPTPFRASGSSALHMTGFAASLVSSFIVYSERVWSALPLLLVMILSAIAASFALTLPETKGQEMPQTVLDAEKIILEQSLCRKAEVTELRQALSKVLSAGLEPIHRSSQGRISQKSLQRLHNKN